MLTDDKVKDDYLDVHDNINTRDQNRTLIVFGVLLAVFIFGLIGLGLSHAPAEKGAGEETPIGESEMLQGQAPAGAQETREFSVRKPVDQVELPGTIGKPQKWSLNGRGNSPAAASPQTSATTSTTTSTAEHGAETKPAEAAPAAGH